MLKIYTTVIARLQRDEKGASAVEYAILVGVLGALVATAVTTFGTDLGTTFSGLITKAGL
jgi:pilus assembly protein Flp/PilA